LASVTCEHEGVRIQEPIANNESDYVVSQRESIKSRGINGTFCGEKKAAAEGML
jgi:hypothetical protein